MDYKQVTILLKARILLDDIENFSDDIAEAEFVVYHPWKRLLVLDSKDSDRVTESRIEGIKLYDSIKPASYKQFIIWSL